MLAYEAVQRHLELVEGEFVGEVFVEFVDFGDLNDPLKNHLAIPHVVVVLEAIEDVQEVFLLEL